MSTRALALAEIATDGAWAPTAGDPGGLVATYRTLLDLGPDDVPAGIVIVWARRAFSRGRSLPAGGVLLGIDVELVDRLPLPRGPEGFMVDLDVRRRDGQRPVVTIKVSLRAGAEAPFAHVTFVLLWPEPS